MSSLIGVRGRLLRMDSTSHRYVCKVASVNIVSVDIAHSARFTDFINDSYEPPIHGLRGGLNFHVMFLEFKCCVILLLSRSFTNALSSYSPPIKLLQLSDVMIFTCPLLAINRLRANINDSFVRLSATSRCNALIVKQTETTPYRLFNVGFFLVRFIALTFIGPK